MKKLIFITLTLALFFFSCSKENDDLEITSNNVLSSHQKKALLSIGINADIENVDITESLNVEGEMETFYNFGDTAISESVMQEIESQNNSENSDAATAPIDSKIFISNNTNRIEIPRNFKRRIYYGLVSSDPIRPLNRRQINAFYEALRRINALGLEGLELIGFETTANAFRALPDKTFTVLVTTGQAVLNDNPTIFGAAILQRGKRPSIQMNFNSSHTALPFEQQVTVMIHEIGHSIGFRHSDWKNSGSCRGTVGGESEIPFGVGFEPIPTTDGTGFLQNSIMKACFSNFANFTEEDKRAFRMAASRRNF
ncbi:M57 family metalloprotease [Aquimarina sp. RZ0]|uniref:M57 family metalloprotease n=1 Tax=Aquimarina sp. RZ0 TaxID=2607730 RepID=UPI0011F2FF70|nr:M57 family metalloprotease [Aquimarina sp. RZ0]KAA1246121.1 hypothetical protein F0000_09055 [Aquimarina sp. RZ0]